MDGATVASEEITKKELSYVQLKGYVQKARSKIKKLEEEKKALLGQAEESSAAQRADAGLVASLREEVELWKTNFQQQIEASATASGATESTNGEKAHNGDSESPRLGRALQEAEEAREEAERWKEKALAAQEFQARFLAVEEELNETRLDSQRAEQELRASHEKERADLEGANQALLDAKSAIEAQREAAEKCSADLQAQADTLIRNAGALEHHLLTARQECDQAVARSGELEQEVGRLGEELEKASEREGLVVVRREGEILVERAGGLEAALDETLESLAAAHVELNALKERQAGMEEGLVVARREGEILVERAGGLEAELDALFFLEDPASTNV
ncbi:unnamed protein product [Ascophyllum nodosum]